MNFFLPVFLSATSNASGANAGGSMTLWMLLLLVFFAVYMWVISRRDKKARAQEQQMRDSLLIGDEVLTIGGVMGRVVSVKEDSIVIETGSDRTKIRFTKTAIASNLSQKQRADADKAAAAEKAAAAKAEKKAKKEKK